MAHQTIDFNQRGQLIAQNEKISGLMLDFVTLQTNGTDVATLSSYQGVGIDIDLTREGQPTKSIFKGYLEDLLLGLYSQTPDYDLWHTQRGNGYMVKVDFGGTLNLEGRDKLEVKLNARNTAFTSLSTVQSHITMETIPSVDNESPVVMVDVFGVQAGETNIVMPLGNNVMKIVAAMDYTTDYFSSTKSKFDGIQLTGQGLDKNVSQNLLELENIGYLNLNPETEIEDLVLFASSRPVHDVNLRGKLDKAIETESNIIVVRKAYL